MKTIRKGTFETNSSSTHSITICKKKKPIELLIPRNSVVPYMVEEYGDVSYSDETYDKDVHNNEVNKLRFLINMIASIYDESLLSDEWDYNERDNVEYNKQYFKKLINSELFVWLKEVVAEETKTEIEYVQPSGDWFPFFETTYSENDSIENLLCLKKEGNSYNEELFKNRVREIIFNNDIVIENVNCPYGMERY